MKTNGANLRSLRADEDGLDGRAVGAPAGSATFTPDAAVLTENLRLFFGLYRSPMRTMGRIVDEGSLLFGAGAVLVVGLLMSAGGAIPMYSAIRAQLDGARAVPAAPAKARDEPGRTSAPAATATPAGAEDESDGLPVRVPPPTPQAMFAQALVGATATSVLGALFGLAVLY